jgi:hypothetical protein
MKNFLLGRWYCDECETARLMPNHDITVEMEKSFPQVYLRGFHIHVQGVVVPLLPFCIYVDDLRPWVEALKETLNAQEALELENRLYELTSLAK